MQSIWIISLLLMLTILNHFQFQAENITCELQSTSGRIVMIHKTKFKHCPCNRQEKAKVDYPSWLSPSGRGLNFLQGLPIARESGTYDITLPDNICIKLTIDPLNNTDPQQFKCNLRWPTLAAIILDVDLYDLSPSERLKLWTSLKDNLKGAAGLRLLEDVVSFEKSIFVLASGLGNFDARKKRKETAVVWQIGCGSVELRHLKTLQWLERASLIGEFSQLIGDLPVGMWFVADFYNREKINRIKREALYQRSKGMFSLRQNEKLLDSRFSGTLLEGSGLSVMAAGSGDKQNSSKPNIRPMLTQVTRPQSTTLGSTTPRMPVVRRKLTKLVLTIQQINNFKIPRETFYDPQDGFATSLQVKVFYSEPKTEKQIEIFHNDSNWISYDKDLQNIRFLAKATQIGSHKLIICAHDKENNKICENFPIEVKPQTPISKTTVLQIAAGALWTYEMPSHWLDGLTFNSTSDLTFSIEGDAIFCWDESSSILQVVTEAIESRILKIIFNITNPKEYQTLKYEFTLAVSDVSPISHVMSDIFQMRVRWTGPNLYPLLSIKNLLASFAQVLKEEKIATYIDVDELLIYKITQHRNFRVTQRDASPDDILSLQIVYRPLKNATCDRAALRNTVSKIQARQTLALFYVDAISRKPLKGRCNHAQMPPTTPPRTSTSTTTTTKPMTINTNKTPIFYPSKLIDNIDVQAGHAFMRELNVKAAINEKLVRYFSLNDEESKNVSDSNWIALPPNGTYIYGLPLKHHVRKTPYNYKILLHTVTGHVLQAPISITVKANEWTTRPINHLIKLKLKLIDKDINKEIESQKVSSLLFRTSLVKQIDRVLTPNCGFTCAKDIILFDIKIIQKSLLSIEWSYLPVLDTDGDLKEPGLQCPWDNVTHLFASLTGISNYPIGPQTTQQVPAQVLSDALQKAQIGSVVGLTIERLTNCAIPKPINSNGSTFLPNITAYCGQGFRVPIKSIQNDKSPSPAFAQLFTQSNIAISKTEWIAVAASYQFIYGLPMKIHTTPGREYILSMYPQNERATKNKFVVRVLPYPFQSHVINHEVRMRLTFISHTPISEVILAGLDLRWKIASALDSYLRPACSISTTANKIPDCASALDVILFELNRVDSSPIFLDVRWALNSIVTEGESRYRSYPKRVKRQNYCPESKLQSLKRKLFGEGKNGPEPLKELQEHLRSAASVAVNDINLERLGPCKGLMLHTSASTLRYGPLNQDDSQKMFLITTVIPVCAFTICILFVALMIALCMKRRSYSGYVKASQNSQLGPGSPVILPDEIDRSSYPPSKPLILPHEKPPLPPPDYNHEPLPSFVNMTSCSYRGPNTTIPKMSTTLEMQTSTFNRQQTPSIRSSPHSHDRFPHGMFG